MNLPDFKYHPDPIATGSIEQSDEVCECCGKERGYIYTGPIFAEDEISAVCPWCIADGSAHEKFDAEFTDSGGVVAYDEETEVPDSVLEEVSYRTPGFTGWQQEHWVACCGDAAAFVGTAGHEDLTKKWPDAIPSIQQECGMEDSEWESYFEELDKDGSPTAYVFKCLHCGKHLGYSDCD